MMKTLLFRVGMLIGLAAIGWVAQGLGNDHPVAQGVTVLIAIVYLAGCVELSRFRGATRSLDVALRGLAAPVALGEWLAGLPVALQGPVKARIAGERAGLPMPVVTPYLVGLLVMLGMLGTFLGMVMTLKGAVFALEDTADLQAIRAGLAAPIRGLGMAFGTSVAGVAASAMLGLLSTLVRRERLTVAERVDAAISGVLREFTRAHRDEQTVRALQAQADALPQVIRHLETLAGRLEQMGDTTGERLLAQQRELAAVLSTSQEGVSAALERSVREGLDASTRRVEEGLLAISRQVGDQLAEASRSTLAGLEGAGREVGSTLATAARQVTDGLAHAMRESNDQLASLSGAAIQGMENAGRQVVEALGASARLAGEHMKPVLEAAMQDIATHTQSSHLALLGEVQVMHRRDAEAIETLITRMVDTSSASSATVLAELQTVLAASEALVQGRQRAEDQFSREQAERLSGVTDAVSRALSTLREEEAARAQAAIDRLAALETHVATHLERLGSSLETPLARLIDTASEAPRAAAALMERWRQDMSAGLERDNAALAERERLMAELGALLAQIGATAERQQQAVSTLVHENERRFGEAEQQLTRTLDEGRNTIIESTVQLSEGGTRIEALAEAFSSTLERFGTANDTLVAHLARIEAAMDKASTRSDEQLAYYVAQAREVIDLSLLSQKEILESLRQFDARHEAGA